MRRLPFRARSVQATVAPSPGDTAAEPLLRLVPSDVASRVVCAHCGLDVPPGRVVDRTDVASDIATASDDGVQFCCAGCQTAFEILHEHGLARYYDLPQRREQPVRSTGRGYEECDHATFHELYVSRTDDGLSRVEFYLEGVHCASCVWLVERMPLVVPGVVRAELNVRRSLAVIEWDAGAVPLSRVASALDSLGYPPHPFRGVQRDAMRRREDRAALIRIGVAGAIAINVMLPALALYSGMWSGMEQPYVRLFRWISLLLAVPAVAGPGRVFFTGALAALRTRTMHMDLPIAIALGTSMVRGAVNTVTDTGPIYFDGVTLLVFLLLCGRLLQQRGQRAASDAAELLYRLTPARARVLDQAGHAREVPAEAVVPGDLLEVLAGETFAADGVVERGASSIDASLLTGESRPAEVRSGHRVYAGTLNRTAPLRVRITEAGTSRRIAGILRRMEEAARHRAPVVELADRVSGWFVAAVLLLAAVTYGWWLDADAARAADNAVALLVVTCPCALALATPLAVAAAVGRAARSGILIKSGAALEVLARPAHLVLDKTGTLTEGVTTLVAWDGPDWVKPLVLDLERGSTHPVAAGFRRAWPAEGAGVAQPLVSATHGRGARRDEYGPWESDSVEHLAGCGVRGRVRGRRVVVGSPSFVAAEVALGAARAAGREVPSDDAWAGQPVVRSSVDAAAALTPVCVAVDGAVVAHAGFGDALRPGAKEVVHALAARGWRISILSGDDDRVVAWIGEQLGLPAAECMGRMTPEAKLAWIESARTRGRVVMVGDGVNDAAAIAAASVGIGVHGGAEASLASADVYFARPGLQALVPLADGARRTLGVIRRNMLFSLCYNLVGVTLAMAGAINPLVAAVLMPASSLTVLLASWRSRTFTARPA